MREQDQEKYVRLSHSSGVPAGSPASRPMALVHQAVRAAPSSPERVPAAGGGCGGDARALLEPSRGRRALFQMSDEWWKERQN